MAIVARMSLPHTVLPAMTRAQITRPVNDRSRHHDTTRLNPSRPFRVSTEHSFPQAMRFAFVSVCLSLVAAGAMAQLPTLTRVGEIGCSDCGTAAQFATIRDVMVTDSGAVLVVGSEDPTLRFFDRSGAVRWSS